MKQDTERKGIPLTLADIFMLGCSNRFHNSLKKTELIQSILFNLSILSLKIPIYSIENNMNALYSSTISQLNKNPYPVG